jgi:hypothetical protein
MPGDISGELALEFQFPMHYTSLKANGAIERNALGLAIMSPTLVIIVRYDGTKDDDDKSTGHTATTTTTTTTTTMMMKAKQELHHAVLQPFPLTVVRSSDSMRRMPPENVHAYAFLCHTYIFSSWLPPHALLFLAAQMVPPRLVPAHEYLYTPGEPASIYLVASGEFRVVMMQDVHVAQEDEERMAFHPHSHSPHSHHHDEDDNAQYHGGQREVLCDVDIVHGRHPVPVSHDENDLARVCSWVSPLLLCA